MAPMSAPFAGKRLLSVGLVAACLGGVGSALGFTVSPTRTLFAYLTAFTYCVSICVGALFVLMIGYAANAAWLSVIRRLSETVSLGLVPQLALFAPIALGLDQLYVWAKPQSDASAHLQELLAHKRPYLNEPFFVARTLVYFGIWITGACLLRRWSRRRDEVQTTPKDPLDALSRERQFSSFMLVPVSLATTFCSFDWLMSLQPEWFSTTFGVYFFGGAFLAAFGALSVLAYAGLRAGALRDVVTPNHFHALGRMLLAFVVFWAYIGYFQAFLISIANKPSEVSFYLPRLKGAWSGWGWLLIIGHFLFPFLLLLPKSLKFRPGYVASVSVWLLAMHFVDVAWLILPVHLRAGTVISWIEISCLLAVGGVSVAFCAWLQRGTPLVAVGDPLLSEGIRYASGQ